ncbi:MAG TPA: YtxH domain-containing protein [Bacteroidia bacterium]|nr:YtxH domain-containing protein [Bacteroidia bacterium]
MNSSEDNKSNETKIFAGLLLGLAAGTVLGMALAPAKGSETRQKISDWLGNILTSDKNRTKHETDDNDPEGDRPV